MAGDNNSSNGNGNGKGPISHLIYSHPADELEDVLRKIRLNHLTGALTINYGSGLPSGKLEWRERAQSTPPVTQSLSKLIRD